ncbi:MAG: ABC transporter permease, partial [Thermodesulfobacteriota bacterium]
NARVWRKNMIASLIGNLGQPFLFLLALGYGLGRTITDIEGHSYLQFIAPGLTASAVMYSAAFEATYGSYTRLVTQNVFLGILMSPVSVTELAVGEVLWGACKGFLSGIIMLIALPLFGLIPSAWIVLFLPLLFVEGVLFAALGLIMSSLAASYEFFNYFISLFLTPLFLFSGIFFSLNSLPETTSRVLQFLPLTPMVNLARSFCYGDFNGFWPVQITAVCLAAAVATSLAAVLLKRRLIK